MMERLKKTKPEKLQTEKSRRSKAGKQPVSRKWHQISFAGRILPICKWLAVLVAVLGPFQLAIVLATASHRWNGSAFLSSELIATDRLGRPQLFHSRDTHLCGTSIGFGQVLSPSSRFESLEAAATDVHRANLHESRLAQCFRNLYGYDAPDRGASNALGCRALINNYTRQYFGKDWARLVNGVLELELASLYDTFPCYTDGFGCYDYSCNDWRGVECSDELPCLGAGEVNVTQFARKPWMQCVTGAAWTVFFWEAVVTCFALVSWIII